MKRISLTQGQSAIVDSVDYDWLTTYKWYALRTNKNYTYYAVHNTRQGRVRIAVRMHRLIMNASLGQEVDHVNGDGLDNRRDNLRLCTHIQNMHNRKKYSVTQTSQYKGVSFYRPTQSWRVQITICRKKQHIGYFSTEEQAAKMYDEVAIRLFGEFARLNFPKQKEFIVTTY